MGQKFSLRMKNLNSECTKTEKIGFYWIAAVAVAILLFCFRDGISGNDFWWHVKTGEWISAHGFVPQSDIFSWYGIEKAIPWSAHEWLSEVLFYGIYSRMGEYGIYFFSLTAAMVFLIGLLLAGKTYIEKNLLIGGIYFAIIPVVIYMFFYGRPQVFGFFFLFLELWCLYRYQEHPDSRAIYLLPLTACLWSNLHGGSSCMSYLLCVLFLTAGLCRFRIGRIVSAGWEKKQVVRLLAVTVLVVAALFVNPIGWKAVAFPYVTLSDNLSMSVISEWAAPDIRNTGHLVLFFLPFFLMLAGFVIQETEIRLIDLLVLALFGILFLRSQRFAILFDTAAVFCAFRYMPKVRVARMKSVLEYLVMGGTFTIAVAVGIVCVMDISGNLSENRPVISTLLSGEMLEYVSKQKPKRLFNDYNYGGELIFHEIPVYWDGRADMYVAEHMMEDGTSLMYLREGEYAQNSLLCLDVEQLIEYYKFDAFLLMKDRPLCAYLISHPEKYRAEFSDGEAIFFTPIYSKN